LLGNRVWDVAWPAGEARQLKEYFARLLAQQPSPAPRITHRQNRRGEPLDLHVVWNYKRTEAGKLLGFVAVITDPDRRSRDILSGGMIEVVSASPDLSARLNQAPKGRQPFVLAEEGLWYDALAGVSERIDAAPKDLSLRKQRAALLDQVGLNEAAEFDLKEARSAQ
jgi:hypothetical protein